MNLSLSLIIGAFLYYIIAMAIAFVWRYYTKNMDINPESKIIRNSAFWPVLLIVLPVQFSVKLGSKAREK